MKNINEIFTINKNLSKYTNEIKNLITQSTNRCSIHIRRGDYINDPATNKVFGTCSIDYYNEAINIINSKFENMTYFVFSNDIAWTKENIKNDNVVYVNSKENRIPHEDIYLMSLCKNNIIANSSFSWWGAYLNKNIIAPKNWFIDKKKIKQSKDLVPSSWTRL